MVAKAEQAKIEKEVLDEPDAHTVDPGDKVAVSVAFKKNLGNYENLDLYTSVTITVREFEREDDTYHRAWEIVERQIEKELEKVEGLLKGN